MNYARDPVLSGFTGVAVFTVVLCSSVSIIVGSLQDVDAVAALWAELIDSVF